MNEIKGKTDNVVYLNFEKITDFAKAPDVNSPL